ncbi:MAG: cytochrome b, partial [Alphaproteobacteria bacterium]
MQSESGSRSGGTYDSVSIAFHWVTVILVLSLFLLALLPVVKGSIALHKSIGIAVLILVPLRILWRLFGGARPGNTAGEPLLLRLGAWATHAAIYVLLLATPILGWLYLEAKGVHAHFFGLELPGLLDYDRAYAMQLYVYKQWAAYTLLALIGLHAGAAILYHHMLRKDAVVPAMLPQRFRRNAVAGAVLLAAGGFAALAPGHARAAFDVPAYAGAVAASLAKACPLADPGDIAAHEACRKAIGQGPEKSMRGYSFLFGGQQPGIPQDDKKTSVFRGDLFQDLYMSLYMYTGNWSVETGPDGGTVMVIEAYFRNQLPPGRYPYPFWHSEAKWNAYQKS